MAILSWVPRITAEFSVEVTPTVSTSAYTAGDQVGGVMTLTDILRQPNPSVASQQTGTTNIIPGTVKLTDINIFIKSNVTPALEILFFRNSPTMVNTDNGVFSITNANAIIAGYLARAAVGSNFTTSGSSAGSGTNIFSTDSNLNITLKKLATETSPTSVFAIMKTTAAMTLGTTTDIVITFNGLID